MPGTNLTRAEAAERAGLLAVERYQIQLDLTGTGPAFGSATTVDFTCQRPGATTFIDLIAPEATRINLNGRELDPASVFADSRIALPNLAASNRLRVEARCAYTNTGEGLHRFTDPEDGLTYLYTQFEVPDARRVFAVFEQPDLKAAFDIEVVTPPGWTVVSNQPEISAAPTLPDGVMAIRHRFATTPRIAPYLTAVIAGPYARWTDQLTSMDGRAIPLGLYARRSLARHVDPAEIFAITKAGFAFYEPAFDFPYPYQKYDQLFVPEFNAGAMENVGAVTIVESYIFRSATTESRVARRAITILHELAHMWFGDLVTMRWWNDLWLNESFAEYASHLAAAEATRWTDAWTTFAAVEKTWAYRQDELPSTHPIMAEIRDLEDVEVNFDGITYAKGAAVLRQLVAWVGQGAFLRGVAAYFRKHAWGNTELADLLAELESASGRDLGPWADLWLKRAGLNTVTAAVETDDAGIIVSLNLRQSAPASHPCLRPHRIAVAGYDRVGSDLVRVWGSELDADGETTPVPEAAGRPRPLIILPNDGDLAYAKVRLDPVSLAHARRHIPDVADPLARAVLGTAVWHAVRDAELPARDYAELALDCVGRETSSSAVNTLLGQLATALGWYAAAEHRDALEARAADRLGGLLNRAAPGSDVQLHLLRAFARHARTGAQINAVHELWSGQRTLDGLPIDTDLRWDLLAALVTAGRVGADRIDEALRADPSAAGHAWAAQLRACVPTPEAKAAAWAAATADTSLANEIQGATILGFQSVVDRTLLAPFVEPYFALLESTWANRSREMATNVVEGLYPALLADTPGADVLGRTDAWLAGLGGRTPALRRLVIEERDRVVRALAAQECDRKPVGR
ncbi:MAG: aminopeptidase N [Bifidobacteriaceae bacterium]|nr:aminopeptidase N [Bifidobacteriaceae bacterium]